jgi:hypothetical protein
MGTVEELEKALREFQEQDGNDPALKQLRDFYDEVTRDGLVKKPEYRLPLADTIGRYVRR